MPRNIEAPPPSRPAYFWWLLANALALCFAIISWAICLHIFQNPEIPRNYKILGKLGRLPELKRYTVLDVPPGNSMAPKALYRKFFGETEENIARANKLLMRNYLTNFEQPLLLIYLEGSYKVHEVKPLDEDDFFNPGVVVRAEALVKPDEFTPAAPYPVFIEYVFPTDDEGVGRRFKPGDILEVKKSPNCAAIVHISKTEYEDDEVLLLTAIPIAYGPYHVGTGQPFVIEPPVELRPQAGFPILKN